MLIENYLGQNLDHFNRMTYHASVERKERIYNIIDAIGGFGNIVATEYQKQRNVCKHLTDKGVVVVTDVWCETLITAWVPDDISSVRRFFLNPDGTPVNRVPNWMANRIAYTQMKERQAKQKKQKRVRYYDDEDEAC